jgi:hypothetical protein
MRLPGFTAEVVTSGLGSVFRMRAPYANRSSAHSVTMAAQCCPPGFDATGCTTPPPPDCRTTGCPGGQSCCNVGGGGRQCVTKGGPRAGFSWCGQTYPTVISCDCPPGLTCKPICGGQLCSVDLYCQP